METSPQTFDHMSVMPSSLLARKGGRRISVCIPARDEESTVGGVVERVTRTLVAEAGGSGFVDEIVVIDDGSSDGTAQCARHAGARVVSRQGQYGKGRAMRAGVQATSGEVIVFLDADVRNFEAHFVWRLAAPLLIDPGVKLVKGFYQRPLEDQPTGGGRVTELVARPLMELYFPELAAVRQPLAGETAAHRQVLDMLAFEPGYGVEVGLLIDVCRRWGAAAIAQVDLGVRIHRNRSLTELRPQATDVLRAALARAGVSGDGRQGGAKAPSAS